ncbi:type II toxin-antitoxin system YafQ family toxin [uncultured Lactobacillus sp.]|uniref:type II toxin-antitoxin system RelE/ParE family toxin n=1 Tax=uncultured Lactobacillus sp. TaxID=153152 RepID=UPI0023CE5E55|nr:type II toxin-antitoxin system YafQ family toxin [uncultured Lactobacillus sp.]MDE7056129.1 type II toxin-antitoxin system YafQ family toxin [Lactobacillus sp.]
MIQGINTTPRYYRSYKKYDKKHYPMDDVDACVKAILKNDKEFLSLHKDHPVGPNREMHVNRQFNDDWLLVYRIDKRTKKLILILVGLGTHDELNRINDY